MIGHWLIKARFVLVTAVTKCLLCSMCLSSSSKLGWACSQGDGRGDHAMGLLRPKLHTGHHQFCLILLAKASHMAGCESRVKSRGRTFHQQWKNMAMIYDPGHGWQMPLSLTLKDQKEEFAKGMHSILGKGNGMWRGMQADRTWHVKASGSSESLE